MSFFKGLYRPCLLFMKTLLRSNMVSNITSFHLRLKPLTLIRLSFFGHLETKGGKNQDAVVFANLPCSLFSQDLYFSTAEIFQTYYDAYQPKLLFQPIFYPSICFSPLRNQGGKNQDAVVFASLFCSFISWVPYFLSSDTHWTYMNAHKSKLLFKTSFLSIPLVFVH